MIATRTFLHLTAPSQLVPAAADPGDARVRQVARCAPSLYRFLYAEVGRDHLWTDRLGWTDAEIDAHLARPDISLWLLESANEPAGYFELRREDDGAVEIAYFGLLPAYVGRGLGGFLLTEAARQAWALGAPRVWLHTSSLDHPHALPNYRARGFVPYCEEQYVVQPL